MKPTNYLIGTQSMKNTLSKLDEVNKATMSQDKVDETQMLLVSLSTCIMLAKKIKLDKEYYQWTRRYLQSVKDDKGRNLSNIKYFIEKIGDYEKSNNIGDEFQNEAVEDLGTSSVEKFGVDEVETHNAQNILNKPSARSTPLPPKQVPSTSGAPNPTQFAIPTTVLLAPSAQQLNMNLQNPTNPSQPQDQP